MSETLRNSSSTNSMVAVNNPATTTTKVTTTVKTTETVVVTEAITEAVTTPDAVSNTTEAVTEAVTTQKANAKEKLLPNNITLNELLIALGSSPELMEAAANEAADKADEAKEARLREIYGDDFDILADEPALKKEKRRPGAIKLREGFKVIARATSGEDGLCEVFNNGYAIYDNGNRKTVLWVPDCVSAVYSFGKLKDSEKEYLSETSVVGPDVLGNCPWYAALTVAGENAIELNQVHPKSVGTTTDMEKAMDEAKKAQRWIGGSHFDGPEEAYLKKEAAEERMKAMSGKQKDTFRMYYELGMTMKEIAEADNVRIGTVEERLNYIKKKLTSDREKFFF